MKRDAFWGLWKDNYFRMKIYTTLACLLLAGATMAQAPNPGARILVVGGGGARGAWGAGYARYLDSTLRLSNPYFQGYKIVYGTSTGSLMAPLIILNEFDKLKTVYTTVSQSTIFSVNPFRPDGSIRPIPSAWRALRGKKSLGESNNLHNYMVDTTDGRPGLSKNEYNTVRATGRFTVAVTNMRTASVEYHCSASYPDRDDMVNWMWASANEPIFMSYYETDAGNGLTNAYVDGGVISNVPVIEALNYADSNDIDTIDVIVNKPFADATGDTAFSKRDVLDGIERVLNIYGLQIRNNNIEIAQLEADNLRCPAQPAPLETGSGTTLRKIQINVYYFPPYYYFGANALNQKELVFDITRMNTLWYAGIHGKKDTYHKSFSFRKADIKGIYKEFKQNMQLK